MSDFPKIISDSRMPKDLMLAIDDDGKVVGGARNDDLDGWTVYEPDVAAGMANLLGLEFNSKPPEQEGA